MRGRLGREAELIPREVGESREVLSARLPLLPERLVERPRLSRLSAFPRADCGSGA
jgi:hypothetical protein